MRKTLWYGGAVMMMTSSLLAAVTGTRDYPCYQFTDEPVLDGKSDDAAWQKAPAATGFFVLGGVDYALERQSSFKMGWTSNALYIAVKCNEPKPDKIKAQPKDGDGIWGDDSVELLFCPWEWSGAYLQFAVNWLGARWSSPNVKTPEKWEAKGGTNNEGWYVEVKIPFEVLQRTPAPNSVWRFNLARNSKNEDPSDRTTCWPPLFSSFAEIQRFATIAFKPGQPSDQDRAAAEKQMAGAYQANIEQQSSDMVKAVTECKDYVNRAAQDPKLQKDTAPIKETMDMVEQLAAKKDRTTVKTASVIAKYKNLKLGEKMEKIKWKIMLEELLVKVGK